jgi:hypothetical protein
MNKLKKWLGRIFETALWVVVFILAGIWVLFASTGDSEASGQTSDLDLVDLGSYQHYKGSITRHNTLYEVVIDKINNENPYLAIRAYQENSASSVSGQVYVSRLAPTLEWALVVICGFRDLTGLKDIECAFQSLNETLHLEGASRISLSDEELKFATTILERAVSDVYNQEHLVSR